jgi:pimeloyl-ACP methyl ester carboxylesterase
LPRRDRRDPFARQDARRILANRNAAKLIVGSEDRLFPPEYCERLARRIGKYGAAFEMVEGGHIFPLENTAQTVAIAAEWFEENLTWDEESRGVSTLP